MDTHQLQLNFLRRIPIVILAFFFSAGTAQAGDIFRWTDSAGHVHFGDKAPGNSSANAGDAAAQNPARVQASRERTTDRFTITIDDEQDILDEDAESRARDGIANIYAVYSGLFHLNLNKTVRVDIHLFRTPREMADWIATLEPSLRVPDGVLGLYMPRNNQIGAWQHSQDPDAIVATLLHESSHVILAQLAANAPAWLQEGMAQYFEGMDTHADGIVIRPQPQARQAIDIWIARKQLVTLRNYFSLDESGWRHLAFVQNSAIPYAVAWSVSYFLMSRPVGRQIINTLLQDMEKTGRLPTTDAIEQHYPGGYAVMEYDWFRWAQGDKPPQTLRW